MSGIILDLCGGTGSWSRPWEAAGYDVRVLTLPEYDVREVLIGMLGDRPTQLILKKKDRSGTVVNYEFLSINNIIGILAAPPCTEFSVLNCKAEARVRDEVAGMEVVDACMRIIKACRPAWWALENPRGYLRKYLGKPTLSFQPWEYGDPWTKATDIWGEFNPPAKLYREWEDVPDKLPLYTRPGRGKPNFAYLHKSAWNDIPQLSFHKPVTDAEFRAMTPPAFAKAFFEANAEGDKE